ncbi:N-acetylmuramoyl-L-alanine amidase [Robiginitomaculum antarcticum]|uniref:N-acetylmuramoyl-L-alanine amidase n=1 Tax=Robiginitomaculum antarcticum TaxID=437507 RepID=UPI00036CEDD3|nr:N-acetylmuramoyl-L-alanine amidase [Robiginitomaculum antarcticum]
MIRVLLIFVCFAYGVTLALPTYAVSLGDMTLRNSGGQTHLIISYDGKVSEPNIFTMEDGAPRVVIDITDAMVSGANLQAVAPSGAVSAVRYAPRGSGMRIVIDLADGAKLTGFTHGGQQTVVMLHGVDDKSIDNNADGQGGGRLSESGIPIPRLKPVLGEQVSVAGTPQISASGLPTPRLKPTLKPEAKLQKKVIVIDAGHGGYDPGSIGRAGTHEKTVSLRAAKELKSQLEKTGRYKVVLTRAGDVFIELDERVRLARRAKADLFISLHADSISKSSLRGASVYTIADHARKRSTDLVGSQNWIMDIDLDTTPKDVDDILVDLAQRKTFSYSAAFADILVPELAGVTTVIGNTHRRAGLAVLLAPDVPAVLIEMGYLSNAQDEKLLNSAPDRRRKMGAVVKAIDRYFVEVEG